MSQPLLRYALELSQGESTGLSYVNAGQKATLSVVVSNAGADVTINRITFGLGPFGQDGTDLSGSPGDISPFAPSGWSAVAGTTFTFEPTGGSVVIGTTSVTFVFQAEVNSAPGTAQLVITEASSNGTANVAPIHITKMPESFVLTGLAASPMLVEPNSDVTLTWNSTPGQEYQIGYPGGSAVYTAPSGGTSSWQSPPVQSAYPSVTYTVSANAQVDGQALVAEESTTVNVDLPQIISFTQPGPSYSSPVTLNWETLNTDHCVVYANGVAVDNNAPANPGAGGYQTTPPGHSTQYEIYAYTTNGAYVVSHTVYITLYQWAFERVFNFGDISGVMALTLSPDGTVLYFGGNWGVTAISTSAMTVIGTAVINQPTSGPEPYGVSPGGLALSHDGQTLYVGSVTGQIMAYQTGNLSAAPTQVSANALPGGPIVVSPDGNWLYCVAGAYGFQSGPLYKINLANSNSIWNQTAQDFSAMSLCLSPDGLKLYLLGTGPASSQPIYEIDAETMAVTQVGTGANSVPMVMTRDGSRLYSGQLGTWGGVTTTMQALAVPGFTVNGTATPVAQAPQNPNDEYAQIIGIGVDPSGGLFVSIMMAMQYNGQWVSSVLFVVDPTTFAATEVWMGGLRPNTSAIAVSADGTRAYYADGQEIVVLSSTGGA